MRVIVTRPQTQALVWVQRLRGHGIDAQALPLIDIALSEDVQPIVAAWAKLPSYALVVFVSPNAVESFFARAPQGHLWPLDTRAASIGPGTTRALREQGVPLHGIVEPPADAEQFDSEALWACLSGESWAGRSVLIVRGNGGRDWLAQTLAAAGATVSAVTAYRRRAPQNDAALQAVLAAAQQTPQDTLWFFSSSEAVDHLLSLAPQARWFASTALATHPRIAARARAAGFGRVFESRPDVDAVATTVKQCHQDLRGRY